MPTEQTLSERDGVGPGTFREAEPRTFRTGQAVALLRFGQAHAGEFLERFGVDTPMQAKMQLSDRIMGIDSDTYSYKGIVTDPGLIQLLTDLASLQETKRRELEEDLAWEEYERTDHLPEGPYPDDTLQPAEGLTDTDLAFAEDAAYGGEAHREVTFLGTDTLRDSDTGALHHVAYFSDGSVVVLDTVAPVPSSGDVPAEMSLSKEPSDGPVLPQAFHSETGEEYTTDEVLRAAGLAEGKRPASQPVETGQTGETEELEVVTDAEAAVSHHPTYTLRFRSFGINHTRVIQLDEAGDFAPEEIAMLEEVAHHPFKHPILHARLLRGDVRFAELDNLKLPYATRHIRHVERLAAAVPLSELSDQTGGAYLIAHGILHPSTFEPVVVPDNAQQTADNQAIVYAWRNLMQQRREASGIAAQTARIESSKGGNIGINLGVLYAPLDGSAPEPATRSKAQPVVAEAAPKPAEISELTARVLATTNVGALVAEKFGATDENGIVVTDNPNGTHWTITARRGDTVFTFHMLKEAVQPAELHYEGVSHEPGGDVEVFATADHYVATMPAEVADTGIARPQGLSEADSTPLPPILLPVQVVTPSADDAWGERYLPPRESVTASAEPPRRAERDLPAGFSVLGVEPTTGRRIIQPVTIVIDSTGTHEVQGAPYLELPPLSGPQTGKQMREEADLLAAFFRSQRELTQEDEEATPAPRRKSYARGHAGVLQLMHDVYREGK